MTAYQLKFYKKGYQAAVKEREARFRAVNSIRFRDPRKVKLAKVYGLSDCQLQKFKSQFLDQLDRCKDDDARRVLLGAVLRREAVSA